MCETNIAVACWIYLGREYDPMKHIRGSIAFVILAVLASNALAITNKCVDANGKITYTNTDCPTGYEAKDVGEKISVVDNLAERALIAREAEKAKVQTVSADSGGNEIAAGDPVPGGLPAADRAKLKEAESLAQTAISAREWLWPGAAIFIGATAILLLFFRRKK
jgi:hypothetical protein